MKLQVDDKNYINIFHFAINFKPSQKKHIKVIYSILIPNLPDRNKVREDSIFIPKKMKQNHSFIQSYLILMEIEKLIQVYEYFQCNHVRNMCKNAFILGFEKYTLTHTKA